jgi:hypothetical protein
MIISIDDSPRQGKRFRVLYQYKDGKQKAFDFGQNPLGNTYIDGASDQTRENYRKRHLASNRERQLIEDFTPSPALFSFYILWGETRSISKNIKILNGLMD